MTDLFLGKPIRYDKKGYAVITKDGTSKKCHLIVWENANGPKPKGYDIHHIDEDKRNFSLSNLQLLSKSDHQRMHAGWIMTDGIWTHKPCGKCGQVLTLENFYSSRRNMGDCKSCIHVTTVNWKKNNREKYRVSRSKNYYKNKEKAMQILEGGLNNPNFEGQKMTKCLDGKLIPRSDKPVAPNIPSNFTDEEKRKVKMLDDFAELLLDMDCKFIISYAFPSETDPQKTPGGVLMGGTDNEIDFILRNAIGHVGMK